MKHNKIVTRLDMKEHIDSCTYCQEKLIQHITERRER